jgi:uncharacterized protein (DUF58 family)
MAELEREGTERDRITLWRAITPLGRSVAVLGVVSWLVAWRTGWVELAVIGTACIVSFLIGIVFLLLSQADLRVLLELGTPRVVVGNPATTRVEAMNAGSRRMLPVRLEAQVGQGVARLAIPTLAANASHDEVFLIPTSRRSIIPVGPVRSVQGDPLGLVRREVTWTGAELLHVHPRTVAVGTLTTGWMRDLEGETTNDRSPSDVAFHTLREYVVGDDRRHIHWRTTARQVDGKLMVREFVDTRRAHLGLLLSLRAQDYGSHDEFELAVSALASLGLRAIADEQDVACVAGRRTVPSFHGTSLLDSLSSLELGSDDLDVGAMATRSRDLLASASVVAVIAGSTVDPAALRRAGEQAGPVVKPILVQVDVGAESMLHLSTSGPVIRLGDLDDLPRLVRGATST